MDYSNTIASISQTIFTAYRIYGAIIIWLNNVFVLQWED